MFTVLGTVWRSANVEFLALCRILVCQNFARKKVQLYGEEELRKHINHAVNPWDGWVLQMVNMSLREALVQRYQLSKRTLSQLKREQGERLQGQEMLPGQASQCRCPAWRTKWWWWWRLLVVWLEWAAQWPTWMPGGQAGEGQPGLKLQPESEMHGLSFRHLRYPQKHGTTQEVMFACKLTK